MDDEAEGEETWHGTNYGHHKMGCRGPKCREWWNAYMRRYKAERMARTGETFNGRMGGFVPGKPCACGCGSMIAASSPRIYRNGHRPKEVQNMCDFCAVGSHNKCDNKWTDGDGVSHCCCSSE